MGYSIYQRASDFHIMSANQPGALAALKAWASKGENIAWVGIIYLTYPMDRRRMVVDQARGGPIRCQQPTPRVSSSPLIM